MYQGGEGESQRGENRHKNSRNKIDTSDTLRAVEQSHAKRTVTEPETTYGAFTAAKRVHNNKRLIPINVSCHGH